MAALVSFAQGELQFQLLRSAQTDLPVAVVESLDLRLKQILNRNGAAAADPLNVFAIEPVVEMTDVLSTEGLVQNVSVAKGELTLFARNLVDGTTYYSQVIPLKGDAVGGKEKAMKTMIANLKVTDPVFTRFVRTTRKKIEDYYAANCALILQQAQGLYERQKYQEAISYLSAVSVALPCYEQASALQSELLKLRPDSDVPDTVVVEHVVAVPVPVVVEVEKPVVVERPVGQPAPSVSPRSLDCRISISTQDLRFKVLKCFGNSEQKRITIVGEVTNVTDDNWRSVRVEFRSAFTSDGEELKNRESQDFWQNFPSKVSVPKEFYVTRLTRKVESFSFVELFINGTTIEIRNLPVEWQD